MKGEKLVFIYAAQQADDLLGSTEVTSADFNSIKALVNGEAESFMGFNFESTELLPFLSANASYNVVTGEVPGDATGTVTAAQGRRCIALTSGSAVLCALGREVNGRVDERKDKHFANQVYGSLTMGSTRMEEVQVVEVICKEV